MLLNRHNENIYKLLSNKVRVEISPDKSEEVTLDNTENPPKKRIIRFTDVKKYPHKTFGFAQTPIKKPNEFLKKNERIVAPRPRIDHCHGKGIGKGLPEVPTHTVKKDKTSDAKNFRNENICDVLKQVPRQPRPMIADNRKGDVRPIEASGLVPKYIHKKEYGKMPPYLLKRMQERDKVVKSTEEGTCLIDSSTRYITEPERRELLEGLKQNWGELQKAYQLLPMVIDNLPKKKRKLALETQLHQLERDIRHLERHKYIYVYND